MRLTTAMAGIFLGCTACAVAGPPPVVTQATMTVSPGNPACRDYTVQANIDGKPQTVVGQACQQADGTWRVTEGLAGQPQQLVEAYPVPYPAYGYDPWLWGPPIGFSIGAFVFVEHGHGHRFHDFHRPGGFAFHEFHHDGFHHAGSIHNGFHHGG